MNGNITIKNNRILMMDLSNILIEKIADTIAIHADSNFEYSFRIGEIVKENHTEDEEQYELSDGTQVCLSFI